jgi:RND family efflux transporter MFP subunit
MKIKIIFPAIVIVVLIVIGFFIFENAKKNTLKTSDAGSEEQTQVAKIGDLTISFAIDGKTQLERRDLKFIVSGKVSHIAVKEGDEVKKWQYLMALDTQDVQKNLQKDLKDYLITRNNFEQTTQITYPDGALTDTIKRSLENNQYALDKSVLDVELQDIALRESYLYSPIDGVVAQINFKEGETTNTQSTTSVAMTIVKPESLTFEAYAEDVEVLKISKDQKVTIKLDSLSGVTFSAETQYISDIATVDANDLSTYKIKAIISDTKGQKILDGMSGQIVFTTKEKNNVLLIPNSAVTRQEGKSVVFVKNEDKVVANYIKTGFTDGKNVEVVSGLKAGDIVIIQ